MSATDKTEQALPPQEREDFERWCEANGRGTVDDMLMPLDRSLKNMLWTAWAGRAALTAAPPAQPQEPVAEWKAAVDKLDHLRPFLSGWQGSMSCKQNGMEKRVGEWIDGITDLYRLYESAQPDASPPRAVEPLPPLPLKVWIRHDAPDGEWWSNGRWTIVKDYAQKWVLSADRREVSRHEYLSEAQFYARTAITKE